MNTMIFLRRQSIVLVVFIAFSNRGVAQEVSGSEIKPGDDSLTLKEIISRTITTHPTVKAAEEAILNADTRINLAKTGYYPEVDMNANYSNIGPVTTIKIPDFGAIKLFPENNYSASLNYRQTLYDFGRTKKNIEYENENKAINEQTLEQTRQKLALMAVSNFYTLLFLQSAIKIKDEQLSALKEHLSQVSKMMATGSATEYQVLSTKVRISAIESQKVDLEAAIKNQQAFLNALIGNDQSKLPVAKSVRDTVMELLPSDSLMPFAMKHRDDIIINQKKISLAELKYSITKLQYNPVLSFSASGGAKNGYVPYLNEIRPNYVLAMGLKVPIFDGMKTRYNLSQARSAITSLSYESDLLQRNVSNEIVDAQTYMISSAKKLEQYSLQLEQALKAYSLAVVSFNSGVITNLDLLDSNTSVSESRLLLLKARIDYEASVYKFKAAIGERIY